MFVLQLVLFWTGLAMLARALHCTPRGTIGTMAVLGLAPVALLLRGHVWTDVAFFAALTCSSGALALAHERGHRAWLLAALPPLAYAAA